VTPPYHNVDYDEQRRGGTLVANDEHVAKLKEGVQAWNEWRKAHPDVTPDLSGADLDRANLRVADLSGADLATANLSWADLNSANLGGADLATANLSCADLATANLNGANLTGANLTEATLFAASLKRSTLSNATLTGADLRNAFLIDANLAGANCLLTILNRADLRGADFVGAHLGFTIFGDNDLRTVKGLETLVHVVPSSIGLDVIYRSQGKIPAAFLRGCGVPEDFITYAQSLVANPVEFYSCFISYSTEDQDFADRLYADLQNKGVRCWFAPHDIQGGKKIHEQIDAAIRVHDKLLLILSSASMGSEWVKTEIAKARKREVTDSRRVLFPIRLVPFETLRDWECFDADTGKDTAREIREYFIPDFSDWKNHDAYQKAFRALMNDLKAEERTSRRLPECAN